MKKTEICLHKLPRDVADNIEELEKDLPLKICDSGVLLEIEKNDRFAVERTGNTAKIYYTKDCEIYAGVKYLLINDGNFALKKQPALSGLSAMVDCSRNAVKNTETVKKLVRLLAVFGYNGLMLYTEDTFEVDGEPYFGYLRGRYTKAELKEIDAYALRYGIELIPCIQTLAHLGTIRYWIKEYEQAIDSDDVLLVGGQRTNMLLEHIFKTINECFTSKKINIGMDEAWGLGRGKYLSRTGYEPLLTILKKHLANVIRITNKYGFEPYMWSDMLFRSLSKTMDYYNLEPIGQEIYDAVPENVGLIYWDYESEDIEHYKRHLDRHLSLNRKIVFGGSAYTSYRFSADNELGIRRMSVSFRACVEKGIKDYIVTLWGDDGGEASVFSALSSLVKAGCMNYGDSEEEFEKTLKAACGLSRREFSAVFFEKDKYLFYNDCFTGVYDTSIDFGESKKYKKCIKEIDAAVKNATHFKNIFVAKKLYYEVMAVKCELGLHTRRIYETRNRKQLKKLIRLYTQTIKKTKVFYERFKKNWMLENKPYGFEIQSVRIGGLLLRLRDCRERLKDFSKGKIKQIEELETKLLDYGCNIDATHKKPVNVVYKKAVSVNPL